ncbi:hypothetical protein F5B22DRAFT_283730 [Xylaria bambusicola]|uniref:uncharacterized protein n=1 Tax=Xylaria bambusicola TaxID=326684 RepID=UPI0020089396|nr:uncharacterized protein F5B22DRAFT_283730 [Xylaria bambusicola]KAI0513019.1 hypothetical protein F5B22DRAFT_283730 [Xylaria bambusicola]
MLLMLASCTVLIISRHIKFTNSVTNVSPSDSSSTYYVFKISLNIPNPNQNGKKRRQYWVSFCRSNSLSGRRYVHI